MPASTRQTTSILVVAAPGVDVASARRVRARLASAWPEHSLVNIDVVTLNGTSGHMQPTNPSQPPERQAGGGEGTGAPPERMGPDQVASLLYGHAAAIVITPGPELGADLVGLIERADRQEIPVVRLAGGGERRERREFWSPARGGCVPLLPVDAEPALVVGLALGLIASAGVRREMAAELEVERAVKDSAAKLLEHNQSETALAVLVQRALLPAPPRDIDGLDSAVLYRPCCSLSGDLYDVVRLDEEHVAFFLADACGHGVAAALLTMLIGRLLPMKEPVVPSNLSLPGTVEGTRIIPPGEAMTRLNAAYIQRQPESSRLITAMYGVLHLPSGRLALASAGHPPAAISGARGAATALRLAGESGPSLGLMEDAEFPETIVQLQPGETVMFYSDGFEWAFDTVKPSEGDAESRAAKGTPLTDRRRPNERYLEAFGTIRPETAGQLQESLFDLAGRMDQQHGSLHQPDDITLLAFTWRDAAAGAGASDLARAA